MERSVRMVRGFGEAAGIVSALIESVAGLPVPTTGAQAAASDDVMRIFAAGPGRVVVVARDDPYLEYALVQRIAAEQASIVDLTHSRAVLRLSGARARDVLAKLCSIDLHPRVFPANGFVQCKFGHLAIWLHQGGASSFDLFVYRGFLRSLWDELHHAALEYGVALEPL
jgi:methylglutamate dehydrogenase subunit D